MQQAQEAADDAEAKAQAADRKARAAAAATPSLASRDETLRSLQYAALISLAGDLPRVAAAVQQQQQQPVSDGQTALDATSAGAPPTLGQPRQIGTMSSAPGEAAHLPNGQALTPGAQQQQQQQQTGLQQGISVAAMAAGAAVAVGSGGGVASLPVFNPAIPATEQLSSYSFDMHPMVAQVCGTTTCGSGNSTAM